MSGLLYQLEKMSFNQTAIEAVMWLVRIGEIAMLSDVGWYFLYHVKFPILDLGKKWEQMVMGTLLFANGRVEVIISS